MQEEISGNLLKKAEVCGELGISPRTLENLVKARKFPPGVRVGKWCFWSIKVLENWRRRQFALQENWQPV